VKAEEIRALRQDEMLHKITELKEELFNLRFRHEIGQLDNPLQMKKTKRNIARLKTIMNETNKKTKYNKA
jgi:large subunit ribosomal protein L29